MPSDALEVLKGTLDMMVLKIIEEEPQHGYGITRRLQALTSSPLKAPDSEFRMRMSSSTMRIERETSVASSIMSRLYGSGLPSGSRDHALQTDQVDRTPVNVIEELELRPEPH